MTVAVKGETEAARDADKESGHDEHSEQQRTATIRQRDDAPDGGVRVIGRATRDWDDGLSRHRRFRIKARSGERYIRFVN